MATLTITSNGRVTFPKELLKHLDAQPGDRLDITCLPGGRLELKAAPAGKIEEFLGALAGETRRVAALDEVGAVAAEGWTGRRR